MKQSLIAGIALLLAAAGITRPAAGAGAFGAPTGDPSGGARDASTINAAGAGRGAVPGGFGGGIAATDDRLDVPLNPQGVHDPAVPAPERFLGYPLGARLTPHHRLVAYLARLAATSARAAWESYGETVEGRPLGTLTVTSPGNRSRLEAIRADLARLADPVATGRREAAGLSARLPLVVWLSFNVHGDEAACSEAALAVAHELAAGTGPDVTGLLDSLIVIIDPCLNPDGHDRHVNWVNEVTGRLPDPHPGAREHDPPWPGGRFNHDLFDLNRDWAWQTQPETKARVAAYLRWRPQVHVDFHEMSPHSSYFFFPAAEPYNTNLPAQVRYWAERFGRGNAAAFDARGWPYYTAEEFDLYYPGYGDSWPTLQGATGMTYEQAGGRRAGVVLDRRDGTRLTLRERIRHHLAAALATLQTARAERTRRLADFHLFFEEGVHGRLSGPAAFLFPPGPDPGRTAELVNLLLAHGAAVRKAAGPLKVADPRDYDGRPVQRAFPAGTWVVPMRQPRRALLNALLEPEAALPETLFYDISAWSLPLAFGVEAFMSDAEPTGSQETVERAEPPAGGVAGGPARMAWLLPWDTNAAPKLLSRLLGLGARASFATRAFEVEGRLFDRGTIVIPVAANADTLGPVIDRLASEAGLTVQAARTGLTGSGIDLGSDRILPIRPPRVALVAGDGVSATSFGAVRFLLDRQYEVPLSVLTLAELDAADLSAFNALVFPDDDAGDGSGYAAALDSLAADRVKRWVRSGGVFIGLKGGAAWATAGRAGLATVRIRPEEAAPADGDPEAARRLKEADLARRLSTVEERERAERLKQIPGTILRVRLDPSHPLAFGYGGEARILKMSRTVFEPSEKGRNVGYYPESPRISGYISAENEERLADTPFVVVEDLGRGHVVLYNEDPNFRVFWYGLNRLFLNSLFFASGL